MPNQDKYPTNEKHELIIKTQNKSKVGGSGHIESDKNTELEFKAMRTGELNYYCEYHHQTMRRILIISEPRQ